MEEETIIDYRPYLQSIEEEIAGIRSDVQNLKSESFFDNEKMDVFVPYANTSDIANLLFGVIIMLGLIFGALVFRHFRK